MQRVFISYAHKDGLDFTRRLAFALSMYIDVFWDRKLQIGDFPSQLYTEVETSDNFILVMTPHSLNSDWCRKELTHAEKMGKKIALVQLYSVDDQLKSKYTIANFTEDFEVGFRRLTAMILGTPLSSWEYLSQEPDDVIPNKIRIGAIPVPIVKALAEWIVVEKLWVSVENYTITHGSTSLLLVGLPRTHSGVLRQCESLLEQFASANDAIGCLLVQDIQKIVENSENKLMSLKDSDHRLAGNHLLELIKESFDLLLLQAQGANDARLFISIQNLFHFDVTEKLRELTNDYARRSRYLY